MNGKERKQMEPIPRCPVCGSYALDRRHGMAERNFTVAYVDWFECRDCGHRWEPPRTVRIRLGLDARDELAVPDGGSIRITWPDGRSVVRTVGYVDPTHFTLDGSVYHQRQFAEALDRNPGTVVEVLGTAVSRSVKGSPRFYKTWVYNYYGTGRRGGRRRGRNRMTRGKEGRGE